MLIFLVFIAISCGTTKVIEVPVDRVRTEYIDRHSIDTVIKNDSIIIRDKGDTVFLEKYKYLYKYVNRTDTVLKTDTITKVQTVEVIKEVNKVKNWQIGLMVLGGSALALGGYKLIKTATHSVRYSNITHQKKKRK